MRPDETGGAVRERRAGDIVDAVFAIACPTLPVDHAYALSKAIEAALPWFSDEPEAGLHTIHGAASGSGWMRPEGADALLQLPLRARLALRLPVHRFDDAAALVGRTLDVAGWRLRVDKIALRPLSRITTLFSRSVIVGGEDEADFSAAALAELDALGIRPGRIVCGRTTPVATPAHIYGTRSLMVAGLAPEQSLMLQRHGLGAERKLGCGVFIPHKDIADLRSRSDDS
jgi:CRISPR-associated protein Cas6